MKLIGRHAVLMILSRLDKLVSLCRLRAGRVGRQTVIEKIFSFFAALSLLLLLMMQTSNCE